MNYVSVNSYPSKESHTSHCCEHEHRKHTQAKEFSLKPSTNKYKIIFITRVGTAIVATIYLQLIQNRYMFRSFTVLHCSHQLCVQPVASDVEVVGYL